MTHDGHSHLAQDELSVKGSYTHFSIYPSHMVAEPGRPHGAERILDVLIPLIMEEIVQAVNAVPWERIAQRICEQIVDVDGSQVAEQDTEALNTSSRDRTLQRAVEQILDVPLLEMVTQLVEVPETIDRIQQRTVEQIVDAPVPQAVEELAEVSRVFSQDRIQQRAMEQTTPAISLAGKIVECLSLGKRNRL